MVRIRQGGNALTVTKGAFKEFFKKNGWVEEDEPKIAVLSNENDEDEDVDPEDDEDETEAEEIGTETDEEDDEEEDEDEVTEKPISKMTKKELRIYADLNNINLEGVADRLEDLREAIRAGMQE